jgi:hypothetical protein
VLQAPLQLLEQLEFFDVMYGFETRYEQCHDKHTYKQYERVQDDLDDRKRHRTIFEQKYAIAPVVRFDHIDVTIINTLQRIGHCGAQLDLGADIRQLDYPFKHSIIYWVIG